jgi:hypothetical protein
MVKMYFLASLAAGMVLFYVFLQDPCNQPLRAEFSDRYPRHRLLSAGAGEGSPDRVQCHISYQGPDGEQTYEDIWLYENSESGWNFSRVLQTSKLEQTP